MNDLLHGNRITTVENLRNRRQPNRQTDEWGKKYNQIDKVKEDRQRDGINRITRTVYNTTQYKMVNLYETQ
jgi:5-bromo-4-chloroindolyl phosphate hydrolysis protein